MSATPSCPLDASARVLVTGGAGFIGSALVRALNERGLDQIIVVDLLGTDEKWKNLTPLAFADYLEIPEFEGMMRDRPHILGAFDYVFHLGACSATTEHDASYLMRNNYAFTRDLCAFCMGKRTRFVYASSAATYGEGDAGMEDRNDSAQALLRYRPLNPYGYSKQMFDLHAARAGFLPHIVGLKYFNVFGPNEYHKGDMRSLVCKAYEQILATGKIRLFKSHRPDYQDGEQMRDFLYVKDAVAMTIHLAETASAGGLYNLGSGVARNWVNLVHALFLAMEREPSIEFIDMPESIRHQYQYHTQADITKLRSSGYDKAITSLEAAVADYVQNYLQPHCHLGEETAAQPSAR